MTHIGENNWSSFGVVGVDGISVPILSWSSNPIQVLNFDNHER